MWWQLMSKLSKWIDWVKWSASSFWGSGVINVSIFHFITCIVKFVQYNEYLSYIFLMSEKERHKVFWVPAVQCWVSIFSLSFTAFFPVHWDSSQSKRCYQFKHWESGFSELISLSVQGTKKPFHNENSYHLR